MQHRAGELGRRSSRFPRGSLLLFSLLSSFLKQFSFPWRDLLITIRWTNHPGCKTLQATASASSALQPQQVSLPMEAISRSRFLPKQKLNAVCCLRSHFIIRTNRKLWKGASSEGAKWQHWQAKEKDRVPFASLIFFLSERVYFPFMVWCDIAVGKQWQNLLCKSYSEFPLFSGSQLCAPPTSRSNTIVSGDERKDHGLIVQPVQWPPTLTSHLNSELASCRQTLLIQSYIDYQWDIVIWLQALSPLTKFYQSLVGWSE